MTNESGWVTEALIQFTRSPAWRAPVHDFVDDNCSVFDNDEEMKLEYTAIHKQFKALVDELLTNFVGELGVPLDEALAAVKTSLADPQSEGHRPLELLMNYIFMVDDFKSFHCMMVKRNIELDILAAQAMHEFGVDLGRGDHAAMNEELQRVRASENDRRLAATANGDVDEETALRNAIAASLSDHALRVQQVELQDAELREALALSIQAETERARQAAAEVEEEAQRIGQTDMAAAQKLREEKLTEIAQQKELSIEKLTAHVMEAREMNEQKRRVVEGKDMSAPPGPTLEEQAKAKSTPAPAAPPETQPRTQAAVPAPEKPRAGALPSIGGAALPPIQRGGPLRPLANPGTASTGSATAAAASPAPVSAAAKQPTKDELEARARHMKEQRARILAQNKAQRQQELTDFSSQTGAPARASTEAAAQKQLTVDIARRLREDMVREATKKR